MTIDLTPSEALALIAAAMEGRDKSRRIDTPSLQAAINKLGGMLFHASKRFQDAQEGRGGAAVSLYALRDAVASKLPAYLLFLPYLGVILWVMWCKKND